jgi:hypothetical protein
MPATSSTYPKGEVSCFADTFVVAESSVLRMEFSGINPALRVVAHRYGLCRETKTYKTQSKIAYRTKNIMI